MIKLFTNRFFLFLYFFGISTIIFAQNGTISGKIIDEKKEPIFMASIVLKGTTVGATTDFDGNFSITAKAGTYNVEISFIGLKTQTQSITVIEGQNTTIDLALKEDRLMLDAAVVVGYGRRQKRDVTGSVAQIKPKDIGDANVSSVENAMQGRATGIQVTAANGAAGAAIKVNVRGTNSISAGSQPLYVIDGIPMTSGDYSPGNLGSRTNAMSDLDPNDIESIDVLKDASSAAIYGARGSNGVILITTKKGAAGTTKFTASYKTGTIKETNRLEFISAEEHLALRDAAGYDDTDSTDINPSDYYVWTRAQADSLAAAGGTDWIDKVLRTGFMQEANVTASGGSDKTTFYFSGSYKKEKGFLVGNDYERINARVNIDNKATEKLNIGINFGISNSLNNRVPTGDAGGLGLAQRKLPYYPIYDANGNYYDPESNPLWQLENLKFKTNVFRTISKIYTDLSITENLKFRSEFGIDVMDQIEKGFNFRNTLNDYSTSEASDRRTFVTHWTVNNFFSYTKDINEDNNLNIVLGTSQEKSKTNGFGGSGKEFSNDFFTEPGDAAKYEVWSWPTASAFNSVFSRVFYKFKNRYIATLNIRTDGSSRFGDNNKYGFFPAASVGWIITDEPFMSEVKGLSYLKFLGSYGMNGNAEIGDYAYMGFYTKSLGYADSLAIVPSNIANPDLKWERSKQLDLTLDYGFLENKISGNITYFRKITTDMLTYVIFPTSTGYGGMWDNVGKMRNQGFEISVNTKNINKKVTWSTDFNISIIRNKVLDVAGLEPDAFEGGQPGEGRAIVGYAVGTAFVVRYAGVQKTDGNITVHDLDGNVIKNDDGSDMKQFVQAGEALYYDKNGYVMSSDPIGSTFYDHRVPCGNPMPKFYGGINNTISYKQFDLNFLFNFVYGNTIYDDPAKQQIGNIYEAQRPEILDYWTESNTETDVPNVILNKIRNSDRFLYDGSYIRLRNISLAYNLPKENCKKLKISKLRVFISATNLLTWTKYPGWDPEVLRDVNTGSQAGNVSFAGPSYQTPQAKTYNVGVQVEF